MPDFSSTELPARKIIRDEIVREESQALSEGNRIAITLNGNEVRGITVRTGKKIYGRVIADLVEVDA